MIKHPLTRPDGKHCFPGPPSPPEGRGQENSNYLSPRPFGGEGTGGEGVEANRACKHMTVTQY